LIEKVSVGAFERERDEVAPFEAIELVRDARLGAFRLPRALGGYDGSLRDLLDVVIRLAEADPNVAHILRAHFTFVESQFFSLNHVERQRWFHEVGRGKIFGSATTEIGTGTTGVSTRHDSIPV